MSSPAEQAPQSELERIMATPRGSGYELAMIGGTAGYGAGVCVAPGLGIMAGRAADGKPLVAVASTKPAVERESTSDTAIAAQFGASVGTLLALVAVGAAIGHKMRHGLHFTRVT